MSTYWNNSGTHQHLLELLNAMIPESGSVLKCRSANKALELFRKASNCYYDLYNNGLINREAQFRAIFGYSRSFATTQMNRHSWPRLEQLMDEIVMAAAIEQGLVK